MKHVLLQFQRSWHVALGNAHGQAAEMTLQPKAKEGGPRNSHAGADQWLFVVDGIGEVIVGGESTRIQPGSLLLIEANETHEIRNTGTAPLKTLNWYVPPAYDAAGDPLVPALANPIRKRNKDKQTREKPTTSSGDALDGTGEDNQVSKSSKS